MKKSKQMLFIDNIDCTSKGYRGEKIVVEAIKSFFEDRLCIGKHGYLINLPESKDTIEADILLLDKETGINIFEVKGIHIENIIYINADGWKCEGVYKSKIDPVYQVDRTSGNLLDLLKNRISTTKNIGVRAAIVLPYITSSEWEKAGFHNYAFLPPIIFQDDLEGKSKFLEKLKKIPYKYRAQQFMNESDFNKVKSILFGEYEKKNSSYNVISEDDFLKQLL